MNVSRILKGMKLSKLRRIGQLTIAIATLVGLAAPVSSSADTLRQGSTTLVSVRPDGTPADGAEPSVSEDGRYVAFSSFDRLTSEDSDANADVYRKDMTTGQTNLVSVEIETNKGTHNFRPSISGDGTKVAYLSGSCLDPQREPLCSGWYAHLRDVSASITRVLSVTTAYVASVGLSRDGKWAAVAHQYEFNVSVNVVDTNTGNQKGIAALCQGCGSDLEASISGTGRFIALESEFKLVPSDVDSQFDVYRVDRDTDGNGVFDEPGKTAFELVGILPNGSSFEGRSPDISDAGTRVAFVGANGVTGGSSWSPIDYQTFVRDIPSGTTALASQTTQGVPGTGTLFPVEGLAIGGPSGSIVAFSSYDTYLAPPDINPMADVYLRNEATRSTSMVSLLPDGNQDIGEKHDPSISYDGRFAAFATTGLFWDYRLDRRVYLRNLEMPCTLVCLP